MKMAYRLGGQHEYTIQTPKKLLTPKNHWRLCLLICNMWVALKRAGYIEQTIRPMWSDTIRLCAWPSSRKQTWMFVRSAASTCAHPGKRQPSLSSYQPCMWSRLYNSGFGHSGTPSLFSPPLPLSFSLGASPQNQLRGLGERCKLPQWGLGWCPSRQTIWCIKAQICTKINLNFCTNTRLLSSRYSVSLRAKHSVESTLVSDITLKTSQIVCNWQTQYKIQQELSYRKQIARQLHKH